MNPRNLSEVIKFVLLNNLMFFSLLFPPQLGAEAKCMMTLMPLDFFLNGVELLSNSANSENLTNH